MRFHFGISFNLLKLKKYIVPALIGLLAFFGLSQTDLLDKLKDIFFPSVFAKVIDDSSTGNIVIDEKDFTQPIIFGNEEILSQKDIFDKIMALNSDYFYLTIVYRYDSDSMTINIFPKDKYESIDYSIIFSNSSVIFNRGRDGFQFKKYYKLEINKGNYEFYKTRAYGNFLQCYLYNTCSQEFFFDEPVSFGYVDQSQLYFSLDFEWRNLNIQQDEDTDVKALSWVYYSNIPFDYDSDLNYSYYDSPSTKYFYKKVTYNGKSSKNLPTYLDLYGGGSVGGNILPTYSGSLPHLYFNFDTKDLSSLNFEYTFDSTYNDSTYIDTLQYKTNFFGSIYNKEKNYYTFEKISCKWGNENLSFNEPTSTISFSNLSCSSDLSKYSSFFANVQFYNLDNINSAVYNIELDSNMNQFYRGGAPYDIYLFYKDLLPTYTLTISANGENYSSGLIYSSNDSTIATKFNLTPKKVTNTPNISRYENPINLIYGIPVNSFYVVSFNTTTDLDILFFSNTLLSINSTGNGEVQYYDSSGNLISSTVDVSYDRVLENDYDINYYMSLVSDYIDSLSNDMYDLHIVIQSMYDSIPIEFRTFILVLFVLCCSYIVYNAIRK